VPDAIKAYNEVLRINPRVVAAQLELSRLNLAAGNRDAAVRYATEAKQSAPASPDVRVALVRSLLTQRDLDRAGIEIAELLRGRPDLAVAHALNGMLNAMRNKEASARAAYTKALELDPQNVEAIGGLVALDLQNKQLAPAVSRIDTALAKQPDNLQLMTVAARVYDTAGQPDKAEQVLRRAVAADPRFLTSYELLAQLYMKQRKLDAARAEFEGIVKREPRAVGPRTMVGIILQAQGKREEAKRWYQATVVDLGTAPIAANNLAYIYAEEGSNLDVALQLASGAKKDLPDNPQVNDTLGWVYYKKDLAGLAIGPLEEAAKKIPDSPEIQYHLGMAYAKTSDTAKARAALERALRLNPQFADAASARQTLDSIAR
jgi:tetratricopeptide (TPR) repeat protein